MAKKKATKKKATKSPTKVRAERDVNQIAFRAILALGGDHAGGKRGTFGKGK
jgi:hypothetical protein